MFWNLEIWIGKVDGLQLSHSSIFQVTEVTVTLVQQVRQDYLLFMVDVTSDD